MTRFLGIDPGYARCGWGIIEDTDGELKMIDCGVIKTPDDLPFPQRINAVMCTVMQILANNAIDILGVEHPLHGRNSTNSVEVGAAYGAVLLAGVDMTIPTFIVWPTQVKAAVANGRATKDEVKRGVETILGIVLNGPDDKADGLAAAICTRDRWNLEAMAQ